MNDLDWKAHQYVLGELSIIEEQGFESLLAEDQGAREAVERAVLIMDSLVTGEGSAAAGTSVGEAPSDGVSQTGALLSFGNRSSFGKRPSFGNVAIAAAALVLVGVALVFGLRNHGQQGQGLPADFDAGGTPNVVAANGATNVDGAAPEAAGAEELLIDSWIALASTDWDDEAQMQDEGLEAESLEAESEWMTAAYTEDDE